MPRSSHPRSAPYSPLEEQEANVDAPEEEAPSSSGDPTAWAYEQPLSDVDAPPEDQPSPPASPASVEGTSVLLTKFVGLGLALKFNDHLTEQEDHELRKDLSRVLLKYDAPDVPFAEEATLAMNVGGLVYKRMVKQKLSGATTQPPEQDTSYDLSRAGQEGLWENRVDSQAGVASSRSEVSDILS